MKRKTASKVKGKHQMMKLTPLAKCGYNARPRPGEYTYSKLGDLLTKDEDRIYVYTVVLDCSSPYYMEDINKYVCSAKLIDDTFHPDGKGKGGPKYMQTTIYARLEKEIPQPTKVGSILRIHRGQTKAHKGVMQLNCDVNIKAAWVLFDPIVSDIPIEHTGKQFTFTINDSRRLADIRKFGREFFQSYDELEGSSLAEAERTKAKDFDLVCVVLETKQKGNEQCIRICDSDRAVKVRVKENRLSHVGPLEVVRIRSLNYAEAASGKSLTLNSYSNILQVPKEYAVAKKLSKKVKDSTSPDVQLQLALYKPQLLNPPVCSKILGGHKGAAVPLKGLLSGEVLKKGQREYLVRVAVIQTSPKNAREWLRVRDTQTQRLSAIADVLGDTKAVLPKDREYCWNLQLFVKDRIYNQDTNLYTVILNTAEGKGQEFFNVDLGRKAPTDSTYAELKRIYKMLTRPWADVDLLLECTEVAGQLIFRIVKTALTI